MCTYSTMFLRRRIPSAYPKPLKHHVFFLSYKCVFRILTILCEPCVDAYLAHTQVIRKWITKSLGHLSSHAFYSSFPFILSCLYFLHMCVFRLFPFYASLASAHTSTSAQAHHRCSGAYPSMLTREWRTCYFARDRAFLGTSGSGPQRTPRHLWRIPRRIPVFFVLPRAPGIRQKEFTHIYTYIYIYIHI
jgi:hypothetical protein